jgi:hypothetical protein
MNFGWRRATFGTHETIDMTLGGQYVVCVRTSTTDTTFDQPISYEVVLAFSSIYVAQVSHV